MSITGVTVVIPTLNRPDSLHRAVESLFWQSVRHNGFKVLIVDNSREASARFAFDALETRAPESIELSYVHEPSPGVANARNMAMEAVDTRLVAFLDDDQTAPIHWLEGLLDAHRQYGATVTFGPVLTVLPDNITNHRAYFEAFFARDPDHDSGIINQSYGCGNCLLDTAQLSWPKPWFDTRMNEVGGEDDVLFARIRKTGGRFAWAANAPAYEHPLPQRINLAYTLRRSLAYGQGPCTMALKAKPPRYGSLLMWVGIGAGKALVHGAAYLALLAIRHPNRAFQLDRAARGCGKLVFWKSFRFYGQATLGQPASSLPGDGDPTAAPARSEAVGANQ